MGWGCEKGEEEEKEEEEEEGEEESSEDRMKGPQQLLVVHSQIGHCFHGSRNIQTEPATREKTVQYV